MADIVKRLLSRAKDNEFVMYDFFQHLSSAQVQVPRIKMVWSKPSLGISKAGRWSRVRQFYRAPEMQLVQMEMCSSSLVKCTSDFKDLVQNK